jgi:hypothetical protein
MPFRGSNNFRIEISGCSNENDFSTGKVIIWELKFQVAVRKYFSRSKIIISDLTFHVVVMKTIFPKEK